MWICPNCETLNDTESCAICASEKPTVRQQEMIQRASDISGNAENSTDMDSKYVFKIVCAVFLLIGIIAFSVLSFNLLPASCQSEATDSPQNQDYIIPEEPAPNIIITPDNADPIPTEVSADNMPMSPTETPPNTATPTPTESPTIMYFWDYDFILPYSSLRELSEADLAGLSFAELRIARNEIYARNGRLFSDWLLTEWFNSKDWYNNYPNKYNPEDFDSYNGIMTSLELKNATFIEKYEERKLNTSYVFPNALYAELTVYDVILLKSTLSMALDQIYEMAGVSMGNKWELPETAQRNVDTIEYALRLPDISY